MEPRIVLVEGFPGCGKSTTAQWLARQFRAAGQRAGWVYEEQRPHPLSRQTSGTSRSWAQYFSERLQRWSVLADQARSSDTVNILESAWLQVPLFLMLRQDFDRDVIETFVRKTLEAIRNADPVLIYLSQPDPDGGMRRLFDRRGMSWALYHVGRSDASRFCRSRGLSGIDGLLQYWREHNSRAEAMARESGLPTLILDPREGDWHSRRSAISQFLNLPGDAQMALLNAANVAHLVGRYRRDATTFVISLQGDELVLDGLLWPRNPLVPIANNVVEAESWPLLLTFLEQDGEVRSVRLDGPAIGGRDVAGLYEKVR